MNNTANNLVATLGTRIGLLVLGLGSLFWATPASAQRQPVRPQPKSAVDISCRPALYFGGEVGTGLTPNKGAKYVVDGGKIELYDGDAFAQSGGKYAFNIQYFIFGSPEKQITTVGDFTDRLRVGSEVINQHTVKFTDADSSNNNTKLQSVRSQMYLPAGESVVTLTLDDDKKIAESNEGNNVYRFTVIVRAKP